MVNTSKVLSNPSDKNARPGKGSLKIWATADDVNGFLVHFRSKGKYSSLVDEQELLAFIAHTIGTIGDAISVAYTANEIGQSLKIVVEDKKIEVQLQTTLEATFASLITDQSAPNSNLRFVASIAGADGNIIEIEYRNPIVDTLDTVASLIGDVIVVALSGNVGKVAVCNDPVNKIDFTRIDPGAAGNADGAYFTYGGNPGFAWAYDSVPGPSYCYNLNFSTATVQEVIDWVNSNPGPLNVTAALAVGGNGSDAMQNSPGNHEVLSGRYDFVGGTDLEIMSTADEVIAAIEADSASADLISVYRADGNDGSGLVIAASGQLLGGADAGTIMNFASEVKAAIEVNERARMLVNVVLKNNQMMFEMGETFLSGGDDTVVLEGEIALSG